jgi:hypothetical protein
MTFGGKTFLTICSSLSLYEDWGPEGLVPNEPWNDAELFFDWLSDHGFDNSEQKLLLTEIPKVNLSTNHGPLLGVKDFIETNSQPFAPILASGFIIVANGPNGDYIFVRRSDSSVGWLPMAIVGGKSEAEIQKLFISTHLSLGEFLQDSDSNWSSVSKDWYEAKKLNELPSESQDA